MSTYYLYARKSSESEDRQVLSIESQIRELQSLAQKRNIIVSQVLIEAKSAKAPGRPIFGQLMKLVQNGKGVHVLCWKLDRLSRNPLDSGRVSWALLERKLLSVITPDKDYTDASDEQFIAQIEFGIAQKFVADLRKNVMRGLRAKVLQGWFPGVAPLGYLNEKHAEKGTHRILVDPERFPLVRRIWDLMLSGKYSVREIQRIANEKWGLRTRGLAHRGQKPLMLSLLYRLLTNPFYYGLFEYSGELHQGSHQPMVTLEEFDRVQVLLGRKGRPRPKHHRFDFTGLIRCGECGAMVTAEEKTKFIKGAGELRKYTYYHCTKRKNPDCPQRSIEEQELRLQVESFLKSISLPSEYLDCVLKHLETVQDKELSKESSTRGFLEKQHQTVSRQLENLLALKISPQNSDGNLLSDAEYAAKKNSLLQEKLRLEQQLADQGVPAEQIAVLTKQVFHFAVYAHYWFINGDSERRREIFGAIGSNQTLKDKILIFQAKKPLAVIKERLGSVKEQSGGLEPPSCQINSGQTERLRQLSPILRALTNDVRTAVEELGSDIRFPKLPAPNGISSCP